MATASVDETSGYSSNSALDDLTIIKGIRSARQQWFRESLGVHTYQDLAAFSADEVETRLRAEGRVAARRVIEGWLVQAQELAAAAKPPDVEVAETETAGEVNFAIKADQALASVVTSAKPEEGSNGSSPLKEGEWKPFASFVVEFQVRRAANRAEEHRTTVHFMEADKTVHFVETDKLETWSGLETERLCRWIFNQVVEKELAQRTESKPAITPPMTVKIIQVRAFQPPQALKPVGSGCAGQPFSGIVRRHEPFALELSFDLTGITAANLVQKHATCQAEFHVRNLTTRATIHLGNTQSQALDETKLAYTALLPNATLPPGVYRLRALVIIEAATVVPGYLEIPLFQVV